MTDFKYIKALFSIKENNGFSEEEVKKIHNVSENIPKVLYDYYTQLGKIEELNYTQNKLLSPNKIELSKDGNYLVFYVENQYVCVWAIHKEDLKLDNPPVYMSQDEMTWKKETERLTDFLNAMASLQGVFSLPFSSEEFIFINKEELEIIKKNFQKKPFCFSQWIGIEFYGNFDNDVIFIALNNEYYDVIYASSNREQFEKMDSIINSLGER